MTDETRACPHCQQPVPRGATVCPGCKAPTNWNDLWPAWHGAPTTNDPDGDWGSPSQPGGDADYEALALDPRLVDARVSRPGKRWAVIALVVSILAWLGVTRLYEGGNPAAYWDYIWFGLAALTLILAVWLVAVWIGRARTHGVGPALRWLVS